jgi:hypothetical protein
MTFSLTVHESDGFSSGVKLSTFTEDSAEGDYFKTMLPDIIMDVFTTQTNIYANNRLPNLIKTTYMTV